MSRSAVLVLSPMAKMSGNYSTAGRIRCHFEQAGYQCLLYDAQSFFSNQSFQDFLRERGVTFIIAIHAYHSGVLLIDCPVPYVIVLGGTDVNEHSKDPEKYTRMKTALLGARAVVSFGNSLAQAASSKWAEISQNSITTIPQAVFTSLSKFSLHHHLHSTMTFKLEQETWPQQCSIKLFLVAGGIRPVKDPLYLVKVFSEWHRESEPMAFLVFMGPVMDKGYGEIFTQNIEGLPGVLYVGGMSMEDTHAAIQDSFALVNSSVSEGMSIAILEAMGLGTPVIARCIPGNIDLIADHVTGLLYNTPQEFIRVASQLISSPDLQQELTYNARQQVSRQHSMNVEQASYLSLMTGCIGPKSDTCI